MPPMQQYYHRRPQHNRFTPTTPISHNNHNNHNNPERFIQIHSYQNHTAATASASASASLTSPPTPKPKFEFESHYDDIKIKIPSPFSSSSSSSSSSKNSTATIPQQQQHALEVTEISNPFEYSPQTTRSNKDHHTSIKNNSNSNVFRYNSQHPRMDLSKTGRRDNTWIGGKPINNPRTESTVVFPEFTTSSTSPPSFSDYELNCEILNNTHFELAETIDEYGRQIDPSYTPFSVSANQRNPKGSSPECSGSNYVTSKPPSLIKYDDVLLESKPNLQHDAFSSVHTSHLSLSPPAYSRYSKTHLVSASGSNTQQSRASRKRAADSEFEYESIDFKDTYFNVSSPSTNDYDDDVNDEDSIIKATKKTKMSLAKRSRSSKFTSSDDKEVKTKNENNSRTPFLPPCKICGAKASGFHYGVNSCEACKGFFRRVLKRPVVFFCTKNNSCNLKRNKRSSCRFCRYKRCLSLGMSKEAIKTGRYSHQKRTQDIMAVKYLQTYKDPDHDYFELDEILEKLLVSHQANIVSSARFQDSYLYKKQKDYHKMFVMHKKIVSTTVNYIKNATDSRTPENAQIRKTTQTEIHPCGTPTPEPTNLERILLNIPTTMDASSQSCPDKSVSPTGSASSYDSGFSDYFEISSSSHASHSQNRNSMSPQQKDNFPNTPTPTPPLDDAHSLSSSTASSSTASSSSSSSSTSSSSSSLSSYTSSSNPEHLSNIKSPSHSPIDLLDDSDTKILEEILKEFKQPFSSENDNSSVQRFSDLEILTSKNSNSIRGNRQEKIDSFPLPTPLKLEAEVNTKSVASKNPLLMNKLQDDSTRSSKDNVSISCAGVFGQKLKLPKTDAAQKEKDNHHMNRAAKCVTGYINFAKTIPGFESLPQQDQATMLRLAWDEIWILGAYRGFNCELGVAVMPSGVCFHTEEMEQSWGQDYARLAFDLADILKKSGVTEEMLVLLKAICILSPDRCELVEREKTEKIYWLLIRCLTNHLDTAMPKPEMNFPGLVAILTSLRNLSELAQAHLSQGILDLQADNMGRNIMAEPVTPF